MRAVKDYIDRNDKKLVLIPALHRRKTA